MKPFLIKACVAFAMSIAAQSNVSAAVPAGIEVSIVQAQGAQSNRNQVQLQFDYTNTSESPVTMLIWGTALEGRLNDDLLDARFEGHDLQYRGRVYKRGTPKASDFVTLAPLETRSAVVDLSQAYDFSAVGSYEIRLAEHHLGYSQKSATSSVVLNVSQPQPVFKQTPSYSSCTASEQSQISDALDAAETIAKVARDDLQATPVNSRASAMRYAEWFGAYTSSRWSQVQANFNAIYSATANQTLNFDCSCSDSYFAYVYPTQPYDIYLCNAFWTAPQTGTDSKAGTIVHELSHFVVVADTDDHVYGQAGARNLADTNPSQAIQNADSHEYFAENTPFISMPAPGPGPDPVPPSASDADDLLLSIAPIIASVNAVPRGPSQPTEDAAVTAVKKLGGRWRLLRDTSNYTFEDFARFNKNQIVKDSEGAGIAGQVALTSAFSNILNAAEGIYLTSEKAWFIVDPWGPPSYDLGSMYVFESTKSPISASHYYYEPSTLTLTSGVDTPTTITRLSSTYKSSNSERGKVRDLAQRLADVEAEQSQAKRARATQGSDSAQRLLDTLK
jgi:peptidyl-Lys metalloendopeptidase